MTTPRNGRDGGWERLVERWGAAGDRLGLDAAAVAAGTVVLSAELGIAGEARALRRGDVLELLSGAYERPLALQALLALERRGVIQPARWETGPWLSQQIELAPQVREHCARVDASEVVLPSYFAVPRVRDALASCVARCRAAPTRYLIVLRGRAGAGRDQTLAALLRELQLVPRERSVFELRGETDKLEPELSGAAAVWDARRADPGPDDYTIARRWLSRGVSVVFALLDPHQDPPDVPGRLTVSIELDLRDRTERLAVWHHALRVLPITEIARDAAAERLTTRSRAGIGTAHRAIPAPEEVDASDLVESVQRLLDDQTLPSTTRGVVVERLHARLSPIVAEEDVRRSLVQLTSLCESYDRLDNPGRKGVVALFSGPSGTGKTLAARSLAKALGRPLYRVDLAGIVSKWVGETEKNLREAMSSAEASGALLLFDEGDALFGKRGEVSKGSDRYANLEVSYLLQALEAFEGIVVITTNLRQNVDDAFMRRIDCAIEFRLPNFEQRLSIWRQELQQEVDGPLEDVLKKIARSAELHGGNIASAARIAATLARSRGQQLSSSDLQLAVEGEFTKLGSAVQASQWRRSLAGEPTNGHGHSNGTRLGHARK